MSDLWDVPRMTRESDDGFWRAQSEWLFAEFMHQFGPTEEAITLAEIYLGESGRP